MTEPAVTIQADEHGLELYEQMLLIRRFEEKAAELYQLGKIRGFLHLYIGEEAVAASARCVLSARTIRSSPHTATMDMRWHAAFRRAC